MIVIRRREFGTSDPESKALGSTLGPCFTSLERGKGSEFVSLMGGVAPPWTNNSTFATR